MAQGDANKVWIVPSDFNKALEGFTKMLGAPGDDGVFRYEPSRDYVAASRPEDDDEAVAGWFDTSGDPHIAALVRAAEEVARKEVPGPEVGMIPPSVSSTRPPDDRETSQQRSPGAGPADSSRS